MKTLHTAKDKPLRDWFAKLGWQAAPFQREMWARYLAGESGLLHAPTGSGKTLAAIGGALIEGLTENNKNQSKSTTKNNLSKKNVSLKKIPSPSKRLRVLWITPLKALASDTAHALRKAVAALELPWELALRTGDASSRDKRLARQGKVEILITTPESLALLLSYADTSIQLSFVRCIIVDEWHELIGSKRGVLLQLNLAKMRTLAPTHRLWGVSATLGNLLNARDVLLPNLKDAPIITAPQTRTTTITSLLPDNKTQLPWAGHLGLSRLQEVYANIFSSGSPFKTAIIFTNTRAQAELWYRALSAVWPEELNTLALHHGSLEPSLRHSVEQGLREARLRVAIATSSLDLGVDFPAVDSVFQIGSPKSVARLVQRAGRAKHRPGENGEILCVPTQAFELLEYAASREAAKHHQMDERTSRILCFDVLAQHLVSQALAGGFNANELLIEIRSTYAYASLTDLAWQSLLNFIMQGGDVLAHYPNFHRVVFDEKDNRYKVTSRSVALRHRLSIGTIVSNGMIRVKMLRGGYLGSVEESFIGRLKMKDYFYFAGRQLQLIQLDHMTAIVKPVKKATNNVASWQGSRLPLSYSLGKAIEALFTAEQTSPEQQALAPLLNIQQTFSVLPTDTNFLIEKTKTRRGFHLSFFPFSGRIVHEGMAALIAYRLAQQLANSFSFTANDYGFMLTAAKDITLTPVLITQVLSAENLLFDLEKSLNLTEMAKREFREIAHIAGLLVPAKPGGASKSTRQLQASSGLIFDVLAQYDPQHILLAQARHDLFQHQLNIDNLQAALNTIASRNWVITEPKSLTPLAFSLWADNLRGHLSTEEWQDRVRRAAEQLEQRYAKQTTPTGKPHPKPRR